ANLCTSAFLLFWSACFAFAMSRSSAVTTMWAICGSVSFAAATPALVAPSAIITPVAMTIGLYMTSSLGVPTDQRPRDRRSKVTGSQRLRLPSVPTLEEESRNDLLSDRVQQWLFFGPPLRFFLKTVPSLRRCIAF